MNPNFQSIQFLQAALGGQFLAQNYFNQIASPAFTTAIQADLPTITTPALGDRFFEEHAAFIQNYHATNRSFLGYKAWLTLLQTIERVDHINYIRVHKGTAYYHAAIFALKSDRFLEGLELMDYGYTADLKLDPRPFRTPGGWYIGLGYPQRGNDLGEGARLDNCVRTYLAQLPTFGNRHFSVRFLNSRAKKYFLRRGSRTRRSAWVAIIASLLAREESMRFIEITPEYGEGQTITKLDLSVLCLTHETLLTYSPEGKRRRLTQLNNLYVGLIDPRLQPVRSYRTAIYTTLDNTPFSQWNTVIDGYIDQYGIEPVAYAVTWALRNQANNHAFIDGTISLDLYMKLFDLLIYALFVTLKLLY